jgi:hypothetical protein
VTTASVVLTRLRRGVLAGALAVVVAEGLASAQTPVKRDPVAAEALFREGRSEVSAGRYETACPKFAESLRLDPALGTLVNLAECEEHTGALASSWEHWRQALDQLPAADDRVAIAQQHVAALEPRLPRLALELAPGVPSDTRVQRDAVELGGASLGVAIPVDPGDHVLTIVAANHEPGKKTVHIGEGQTLKVVVEPGALMAAPSPVVGASAPAAPADESNRLRTAGWVMGGVGVAGFVGAAITGVLVVNDKSAADQNCMPVCNGTGASAVNGGKTLLAVNAAAWALGFAGVGAGATIILLGGRHGATPVGSVIAKVAPGPGGVMLLGSFQ